MTDFAFQDLLPLGKDETPYRLLTTDHVSTFQAAGQTFLRVEPEALTVLTRAAMRPSWPPSSPTRSPRPTTGSSLSSS
jgi:fumarate hydratase class I